jgi:hypothetical protein
MRLAIKAIEKAAGRATVFPTGHAKIPAAAIFSMRFSEKLRPGPGEIRTGN